MDMAAWRFRRQREAWRRFCDELNVDPDVMLRGLPGSEQIEHSEPVLLGGADDDELAKRIRGAGELPADHKLISTDVIVDTYRDSFAEIAESWE